MYKNVICDIYIIKWRGRVIKEFLYVTEVKLVSVYKRLNKENTYRIWTKGDKRGIKTHHYKKSTKHKRGNKEGNKEQKLMTYNKNIMTTVSPSCNYYKCKWVKLCLKT